MREKTSAFESQAYNKGVSRRDYLRHIAAGLSNVERQVADQRKAAALAQRAAANSAANMSMPQMHAGSAARQLPSQQLAAAHEQMLTMANMQQLHSQMMQGKQNMTPSGYQNPQAATEVKVGRSHSCSLYFLRCTILTFFTSLLAVALVWDPAPPPRPLPLRARGH